MKAIERPDEGTGRNRVADGFTLAEVLVVICTIAILLSLLMPALAGARSQARAMACRSNLHQLVLANMGYATENDGFYVPAASDMWDNAGHQRWHGVRISLDEPFDPSKGPLVGYLTDGRVKECPAFVNFIEGGQWNANFEQGCGGYGYNMAYLGSRLWETGMNSAEAFQRAYCRTASIQEVRSPGRTLMFADAAMANGGSSRIEYSFAEPPFAVFGGQVMSGFYMSPSIHFRHSRHANIGWADGHVAPEPIADLDTPNAYGADSSALELGWFEPVDNTWFDLR